MLLDILTFIFQDFGHWLGTIILIYVIGTSISVIVESFRTIYQPITYNIIGGDDSEEDDNSEESED